jgi:hypothetical protein
MLSNVICVLKWGEFDPKLRVKSIKKEIERHPELDSGSF